MKLLWDNLVALDKMFKLAPRLLVTLDFDGTLSALTETPAQARLEPKLHKAVKQLSVTWGVSVFILSGRSLDNVRQKVAIKGLYYAGNHGMEIKGPGFSWLDKVAVKSRKLLAELAEGLDKWFPPYTGVLVEDKVFSVSVHYRNLKPAYRHSFLGRMGLLMRQKNNFIHWRRGHKVFEALPNGSADKGHAVQLLLKHLGEPLAIAVGDDLTDEDMFRVLEKKGVTVRVGKKANSKAKYYLSTQTEVLRLLRFITQARKWEGK